MNGLVAVVPVLAWTGSTDGLPIALVRLHGTALYLHAARTAHAVAGSGAVVSGPRGSARSLRAALLAADLAEVQVVEGGDTLGDVLAALLPVTAGTVTVLLHDPRCPLVPAGTLLEVLAAASEDHNSLTVATRPMTDTVKAMVDGVVTATIDRDLLRVIASPLVLSVTLLRRLADQGRLVDCRDVRDLVQAVRAAGERVCWAPVPGAARRVGDAAAVAVLECLTDLTA